MRYQQPLLVATCAMALAMACRKDKDSAPPIVRITAPSAGFIIGIPDTFTVGVAVSDDRRVESLSILLADPDGVPITPSIAIAVNAASHQVEIGFPVTDERIASGQFLLTAVASDGTNSSRDFLPVTVQAAPLRVRSTYLVAPASQAPPYPITRIDSTGEQSTFAVLGELASATIDLDHLYTAGTATEPLRRWSLNSGSPASMVQNTAMNPGFFKGLRRDPSDGRIYVCSTDGHIRGFGSYGNQVFSGTAPAGFVGEMTIVAGGFLFCAVVNPVTQQRQLVKHGYSSGVRLAEFNSSASPVGLYERGDQHVLLFGNTAAGGVILDVNTGLGGAFELRSFPDEPIRCVERVNPGRFVLGFASGIRRFDYQTNTAITIVPGVNADGLSCDPTTGSVLASVGNMITVFDPATGAVASSLAAPHPVGRVLLQLNR